MAKGTDLVALRGSADVATLDILSEILLVSAKDKVKAKEMMEGYQFADASGGDAQESILKRILNATDDDEAENIGAAIGWQKYLGIPMQIQSFRPLPSEKEGEGPPFYFLCELTNMITGDDLAVSIGSWGVLGQLINLAKRDMVPGAIRILEKGDETKAGRNPLRLVSTQREIDERTAAKAKERL
jgi:hypothetical protein